MPKYSVNITRTVTWTATVNIEAENEDKAADLVEEQGNKAIDEGRSNEYAEWELDNDYITIESVD